MGNLSILSVGSELSMQQKGVELQPGQCESVVYDEAFPRAEEVLTSVVNKFAEKGVSIRFQSVESMADEGYNGGSEAQLEADGQQYITDVILGCRWDESNAITVFVSADPRYYDIVASGEQNRLDATRPDIFRSADSSMLERLRTGGADTYQEDAARTLEDIYRKEFGEVQNIPSPEMPNTNIGVTPRTEKSGSNFPTELTLGIGGGLAIASVAAWQSAGRISVRKLAKEFNTITDTDVISTAYMHINNDPTSALVMLNPDDIETLIELKDQVNYGFSAWNDLKVQTKADIQNLRGKFIPPSKKKAQAIIKAYYSDSADYLATATAFNTELEKVTRKWNEVGDLLEATNTLHTSADQDVKNLETFSTYDATVLKEDLSVLAASLAESKELVDQRFAEKPFDITTDVKAELESMQAFIKNLPEFHKQLVADAKELGDIHGDDQGKVTKAEEVVKDILEFDESCWGDNKDKLETLKATLAKDAELVTTIGQPVGIFDIRILKQNAIDIVSLRTNQSTISELVAEIHNHKQKLVTLSETLPSLAENLDEYQTKAEIFIETNAIDIEDDTEELIRSYKADVAELKQALRVDKPRYLEIDQKYKTLKLNLEAARKKAEEERQEILDLLESNESLTAQVINAISYAENSVNSDVDYETRQDIEDLELPSILKTRRREELRQANSLLRSALRDAQQAKSDAESDRRREENRRAMERAQEQARQAAAARAAAQRASSSFTSSSASRSHHGGGF